MLTDKNIENRRKGIGASESAIVLGLNEHISPYQLWLIKTGRQEPKDISKLPPVYWGTIHEETIAQEYAKVTGNSVRRISNTIFHKKYPHILCHIDRKIERLPRVLECKFAMYHSDAWGETGSDIVPLSYIVQVQHQLACTGYEKADLAVLISGFDFRIYHFERDEAIIKKIEDSLNEFWHYVETDTPPPLRDRTDAALAYPHSNGKLKEADDRMTEAFKALLLAKEKEKSFKEQKEKCIDELTLFIGDCDGIAKDGKPLATWKPRKDGVRVFRPIGE